MKIADAHCDLLSVGGFDGSCMSLSDMMYFDSFIQFFACFISPKYYDNAKQRFQALKNNYFTMIHDNEKSMTHCRSYSDILKAESLGRVSCFLSVEGGECIEEESDIDYMYSLGIRLIAPMWNTENRIGNRLGLTEFGKRVVSKMNDVGIVTDVSHMSDAVFYDVCSLSDKPIFASHSNSRAVFGAGRNLADWQAKEIIRRGGFIGLNLYPPFLNGGKVAEIDDFLRHAYHFLSLGGEDNIGLGCDFDGMDCVMRDIFSVRDVEKIFIKLSCMGIDDSLAGKIAYENLKRAVRLF